MTQIRPLAATRPVLTISSLLVLILVVQASGLLAAQTRAQGVRVKLSVGELFMPAGLQNDGRPIDLLVHLHGSAELLEHQLQAVGNRVVLVSISLNGLSSVYRRQLENPETFLLLCEEANRKAAAQLATDTLAFRHVILSSFSAGFGGVRELLKSPACYEKIDAIVMADSIYAGYLDNSKERGVEPALMEGFERFATDASKGRKQLVVSHCDLQPDGYASTRETADYLIGKLKLERQPCDEIWAEQWQCRSRCERSGLHIFGFEGTTGADHMKHLRHIGQLWSVIQKQGPQK